MKKVGNIKEAAKLADWYDSITVDDIEEAMGRWNDPSHALQDITGFGKCYTCTLCKVIDEDCSKCIYTEGILKDKGSGNFLCLDELYNSIEESETAEELVSLIKERAKYIRNLINKYNEK